MSKTIEPSGEFLELLTDALRAGPGSPEWHQAVTELRKQGGDTTVDEYKLLWSARERLASGKDYRSVRPGPGFTRRVMENIDRVPARGGRGRSVSLATVIAIASLLVLLGVIAIVGYWIYGTRPPAGAGAGAGDPVALVFTRSVVDHDFASTLPAGWRTVGSLGVVTDRGLRPAPAAAAADGADYVGGGIVSGPLAPDEPIELGVDFAGAATAGLVPQVFVTDRTDFSPDRATTPHELVWSLQEGQAQVVLPGGRVDGEGRPAGADARVRIVVTRDSALIETGGQPLWAGAHGLAPDRPRYVGVRFLARGGHGSDLAVTAVRVQKQAAAR